LTDPHSVFIPVDQEVLSSGHILLFDAFTPPQERKIKAAALFYAAKGNSFAFLVFEPVNEKLNSICNLNPIDTVEPISPPCSV
jgi:hypothetical protein